MLDNSGPMASGAQIVALFDEGADPDEALLDRVSCALADPVRRAILQRLGDEALLVPELAAPFDISLQAVSRHIQVLVRAGLVQQQRTGRISRCSLLAGPIFAVAVWINRYSKYWQEQFDMLAAMLGEVSEPPRRKRRAARRKTKTGRKVGLRPNIVEGCLRCNTRIRPSDWRNIGSRFPTFAARSASCSNRPNRKR